MGHLEAMGGLIGERLKTVARRKDVFDALDKMETVFGLVTTTHFIEDQALRMGGLALWGELDDHDLGMVERQVGWLDAWRDSRGPQIVALMQAETDALKASL